MNRLQRLKIFPMREFALPKMANDFRLSSVVLMELVASDVSQRKAYEQLFQTYREDNSLIVPNEDDGCLQARYYFG